MLTKFIPKELIAFAWAFGPQIKFRAGPGGGEWFPPDSLVKFFGQYGEKDFKTAIMSYYTLYHFMNKGPVIVRPDRLLSEALLDTEIRVPYSDYRQPYEIMGVVDENLLHVVWHTQDRITCWCMDTKGWVYYVHVGPDLPTIEDRLLVRTSVETEHDERLLVRGARLAFNVCMLAAHRETELSRLPKVVAQHRMARNRGLRQQAFTEYQELRFRDLVLKPRGHAVPLGGETGRLPKMKRSGHWKNVAYGPKFKLHRWAWINNYETRPGEDWPEGHGPTTILE